MMLMGGILPAEAHGSAYEGFDQSGRQAGHHSFLLGNPSGPAGRNSVTMRMRTRTSCRVLSWRSLIYLEA